MRHTVTGLVDKPADAQTIIDELMARCLCDRSNISLIAHDTSDLPSRAGATAVRTASQLAAAAGSMAVTTISGLTGLASGMTRHVRGVGVLRAFGDLGAALSRTALSTAEDLTHAFVDFGITDELARHYADSLRQGKILLVVDAKTENIARCARQMLATHGAVIPETHAAPH